MTAKQSGKHGAKLIFACSGGSDVGQLADLGARATAERGAGKMYCLAGIGGRVEPILATAHAAAKILAIDCCPQNCSRKTLEQAGFAGFLHLPLSELGFTKGRSEATSERVQRVARRAAGLLA